MPVARGSLDTSGALAAAADPIHHGAGDGTPPLDRIEGADAAARGATRAVIRDLHVVDHADALDAERPTWVAGALIAIDPPASAERW